MSALQHIIATLHEQRRDLTKPYHVPGLWIDHDSVEPGATAAQTVNPYEFYAEKLQAIHETVPTPVITGTGGGEWTRHATVYNLFPRVASAYDHAHDDHLCIEACADGWRDTGTLLKCIALLPYIHSLGINTVHLLPITSVGQDGKKGTLGSPYGIRNAYKLDENLAEPALGLDVNTLFAGFVEAAHILGMRVVMEFVLRTSSKDGDWIGEHPEWFYWIREDVPDREPGSAAPDAYGNPIFPEDDLNQVKDKVFRGEFVDLPAPPADYQAMFTAPPKPDQVQLENGHWVGVLDDGTRVRIPGAFADWPPDDNQPPWTDVTYLRMYDHPDFNYIAYNTIRMYDERLAQPENAVSDLWDAVVGVIPHYQNEFGIDGVMIDMGHALPMPLKQRVVSAARDINPDFAFWDENFLITQKSVDEGYNAVLGYMVFDFHLPNKLQDFLGRLAHERLPLPFFATPESHNTPRAASRPSALQYVHYALIFSAVVPGLPFIHNGFEFMETKPINTGLGFSDEMIAENPTDTLPLFSQWAFDWTRDGNLVGSIRYALQIRQQYEALLSNANPETVIFGYSDNPNITVFARQDDKHTVVVIASDSFETREEGRAYLPVCDCALQPIWGTDVAHKGFGAVHIDVNLGNGHVLVLAGSADFPRLQK
ncbi:MAG: alpha-amylase [Anaerolineae bacterium]|nr:alpha-amylase [Anaerolineae bacterium]